MPGHWELAASDLTYLWDGCRYCFALKQKRKIAQPSVRLPGVFTRIANLQKEAYAGRPMAEIAPGLPAGTVIHGEKKVKSVPLTVPGTASTVTLGGRFDLIAELADGTFCVLDGKTAKPSRSRTALYGRQLHAYAFALEQPAEGFLRVAPVSTLGILYCYPDASELPRPGTQAFSGTLSWEGVPRDDGGFLAFLGEVARTLDAPRLDPQDCAHCVHCRGGGTCQADKAPAEGRGPKPCTCCPWCVYRATLAGGPA